MQHSISIAVAAAGLALVAAVLPVRAEEPPAGACKIHPRDFLATFGFSAAGQSLAGNPLNLPAGPFSQVGTATGLTAADDGHGNIAGTWTNTLETNAAGSLTSITQTGTFTVSKATCIGHFFWTGIASPVFDAVFVNDAKEFRSVAALQNIIIAYSGSKL